MKKKSLLVKFAWGYGISLLIIASLRFIPGISDAEGHLFGLFHLDWLDDILHTITGIWGIYAAWKGKVQCITYFKGMGFLYTPDAIIGLLYGQNPLHIGFWIGEPLYGTLIERIMINGPHFAGGALALYLAYVLGKRLE